MATSPAARGILIDAEQRWSLRDLAEVWHYRELLGFLAWRDVRVRYRQTLVGGAWALIEPFISVVVFTLLFHYVARFESGEIPYPLFTYAAMLGWNFFARGLRDSSRSLVANSTLLRRVYFPRVVLPLACLLTCIVDLLCATLMFGVLMAYYGLAPGWQVLTLPLWVGLAGLTVFGVGSFLAAINVRFRDVTQAIPFVTQMWMLLTPVAYPLHECPPAWVWVCRFNPMTGVVEGMRWALLPGHTYDWTLCIAPLIFGAVALVGGLIAFARAQRGFADII